MQWSGESSMQFPKNSRIAGMSAFQIGAKNIWVGEMQVLGGRWNNFGAFGTPLVFCVANWLGLRMGENLMARRFRGYLPVAVDVETGGFDALRHGLLEIAAVTLAFQEGALGIERRLRWPVQPFAGAIIEPAALKVTGIDLDDSQRGAVSEREALVQLFKQVRKDLKRQGCQRGIILAHNAAFDAGFLRRAVARCNAKRDPFHPFSTIDTASLAAVACGHTVLSQACLRAGIPYEEDKAHSALYDAERCALLFCKIVNLWDAGGGAAGLLP